VQKPVRNDGLTLTVSRIVDFWIRSAVPPNADGDGSERQS
jgi:hypothetical protein